MGTPFRDGVLATAVALLMTVPAAAQEFGDPSKPVVASREGCTGENSVWVTVDGKGDCIRYYAAGLAATNAKTVFYVHGDVMWTSSHGVVPAYATATTAKRQTLAETAARDTGLPVVMIARPGLYGSSGNHRERRQERELKLVEGAMQAIRARYSIAAVGITGQSGGGSVAAYLAAHTPNVSCAVFTSSALSLEGLRRAGQVDGYVYGPAPIYDPIKHLAEMPKDSGRRLFIIGDPQDDYARIGNQIEYFEAAKAAGIDVVRIEAEGDGHHSLDRTGWNVAGWCLNGLATDDIVGRVRSGAVRY